MLCGDISSCLLMVLMPDLNIDTFSDQFKISFTRFEKIDWQDESFINKRKSLNYW